MNTPRERFQLSGKSADFAKMAANEAFEMASDYALLQLQSEMSPTVRNFDIPTDPYVALDANSQMHGAKRVLEILKTLANPIPQPQTQKRETPYHAFTKPTSPTSTTPRQHD